MNSCCGNILPNPVRYDENVFECPSCETIYVKSGNVWKKAKISKERQFKEQDEEVFEG